MKSATAERGQAMNVEAAAAWLAEKLRELAQSLEAGDVLAFYFSTPAQVREILPPPNPETVTREFTGLKELHVVYTTEERAAALVNERGEREMNETTEGAEGSL